MDEKELSAFLDSLMQPKSEPAASPKEAVSESTAPPESLPNPTPDSIPEPLPDFISDSLPEPLGELAAPVSKREFVLGILVLLLAVVGIISLIMAGIRMGHRAKAKSSEDAALLDCIRPLVIMDMPEFSPDAPLTDDQMLSAAIWTMIVENTLPTETEQLGMCRVSTTELLRIANERFAADCAPETYRTMGSTDDLRFYYDAETASYFVPADPKVFTYTPQLRQKSYHEDGSILQLTVDYLEEYPSWKQGDPQVQKTMVFSLQNTSGNWEILSLTQQTE